MPVQRSNEDQAVRISKSIFVTNFPDNLGSKELWKVCEGYGKVIDVFIPNRRSKAGKRFAFVRFIRVNDLDRLVGNLCTIWIGRFHLHANVARFERANKPVKPLGPSQSNAHGTFGSFVSAARDFPPLIASVAHVSSSPALVLDDSCVVERDLSCHVMGRVKDINSIPNLRILLAKEGFEHVKLSYLDTFESLVTNGARDLDIEDILAPLLLDNAVVLLTKKPESISEKFKNCLMSSPNVECHVDGVSETIFSDNVAWNMKALWKMVPTNGGRHGDMLGVAKVGYDIHWRSWAQDEKGCGVKELNCLDPWYLLLPPWLPILVMLSHTVPEFPFCVGLNKGFQLHGSVIFSSFYADDECYLESGDEEKSLHNIVKVSVGVSQNVVCKRRIGSGVAVLNTPFRLSWCDGDVRDGVCGSSGRPFFIYELSFLSALPKIGGIVDLSERWRVQGLKSSEYFIDDLFLPSSDECVLSVCRGLGLFFRKISSLVGFDWHGDLFFLVD
ncbi:RNA-directed DNA polymerase, eukaryota [Tanacetum coccineum]